MVVKIFAHIILIILSISHGAVISKRFNVNIYLHTTPDVTKRKGTAMAITAFANLVENT